MNKGKITLLAVASFAGIVAAIAVNAKPKLAGPFYYGVLGTDNKVRWSKVRPAPSDKLCLPFDRLACTITSTSMESVVLSTIDAYPPQYTIVHNSQLKIFKRINN